MVMRRPISLCMLIFTLVLAGCDVAPGGATPARDPNRSAPAASEATPSDLAPSLPAPTDDPDGQTVTGTLGGDAQLEGGCVWIETADGNIEPLLPDGYSTTTDPVALIGPGGNVIAEEGDRVTLTGAPAFDVMTICQVGAVWRVSEIKTGD